MPTKPNLRSVTAEELDLRARLERAEESLREILSGESDALFVAGADGAQLFTLKGADLSYRTLIENMSEGALTLTSAGLILYANRRFAEMLGTPLEKVIGSDIHNWFSPESRQDLQTLLRKDASDRRREELALVAADGTQVPVNLSVSHLKLEGMPDSFCMVATDLTQQKHNEAILAAESLARAILEQAADAIVICDETGRILRASKQAQAFCGYNPVGEHFEHAFPLRQLDGTAFSPSGDIDTNARLSVEARLERDGQGFDLLVSVGHLKGAGNELVGSVLTLTDITERKRRDEDLRRFRAAMDATADAIYLVDRASMRIIDVNEAACRMQRRTREELLALGSEKVFSIPREELERAYDAVIANGGRTEVLERKRLRQDGTPIWLELQRSAQRSDQGWTIVTVARDITERKTAEARITHLNRVYAVLSGINTLIVRVHDRDELFREACRIAVEAGGFRMALIAIEDRSAMKIVPVASAGKDEALLTAIKGILSSADDSPKTMVARALREKTAVVSNDSQHDPRVLFGAQYAEAGVRAMVVLPLLVADEAAGVLVLYANEIEFFHEEEMKLLTELAGDIAFAIDHIGKQERLDYLAYYDALTGLANRSLFLERVTQYTRVASRGGHKLAVFLIDLARFKNINDSLGQPAGDALLRQVAEWLTFSTGDANLVARIGADHFATVLPELKQGSDGARFLEETIKAFSDHPFRLNDAVFRVAVRVGVAVFPDDGADADTLFRNAEAALKKAKASGERYLFYAQKMTDSVAGKLSLENQLRQAIDNEEFVLHYQPKVNLVSGKVTSVEALIRWNDPRTGLVPPGRFIPILEETGMIYDVGRWALRRAIADYLRWRAAGLAAVRIAVNVSPLQLRHRGFIDEIRQVIGIDAQAAAGLELEITENLIMEDVKGTIASLQAIRALGVSIAIDDFGTGFSSLAYLAKLPVDALKIDRSFVIDMTTAPEGLALVSTIIKLAHSLKLTVVAEGVETEEQARLLRLLACDEMQGFLFSKPVPIEVFETKFLASATGEK